MSGGTLVMLGAAVLAIFLVVVAALLWQEAKRRPGGDGPIYVVDDAVEFIVERLGDSKLRRSDVKRVLEYEIFYLQGLAQKRRSTPVDVVAGGPEAAVSYIGGQIADRHVVSYPLEDVRTVLELEAAYLQSIGAVGDPVEPGHGLLMEED
jgi:hypothetical protein